MSHVTINLDRNALERLALQAKLRADEGNPLGLYVDESEPRIADYAKGVEVGDWLPSNNAAIKLIQCLEAIRDLYHQWDLLVLAGTNGTITKRHFKPIPIAIHSLAQGIQSIYGEIQQSHQTNWPKKLRTAFARRSRKFNERIGSGKHSVFKVLRNKLAAHIDPETIIEGELWSDFDFHVFLPALRHCIRDLRFLMSQDIYQWTRYNGYSNLFSIMSVDGTLVDILIENGEVTQMEKVTFTKSPRHAVATEVNELVRRMNTLVQKSQTVAKKSHRDGAKPK
jgi:hypothetical protein